MIFQAFLHNLTPNPFIHRDLKASNILLNDLEVRQDLAVAKVCDFGLSKAITSALPDACSGYHGAYEWMAPESFHGQFSFRSDVYSFGILLFEIISRQVPHQTKTSQEKLSVWASQQFYSRFEYNRSLMDDYGITKRQQREVFITRRRSTLKSRRPALTESAKAHTPKLAITLMRRCWRDSPRRRPDFKEILDFLNPAPKLDLSPRTWDGRPSDIIIVYCRSACEGHGGDLALALSNTLASDGVTSFYSDMHKGSPSVPLECTDWDTAPQPQLQGTAKAAGIIHASFASQDGLDLAKFQEQVAKVIGWRNTRFITAGTSDSSWLAEWLGELKIATAVLVVFSKAYRSKFAHPASALRKEALASKTHIITSLPY